MVWVGRSKEYVRIEIMPETILISARIEALLFYKGEPVKIAFLAEALNESVENIYQGLATLEGDFVGRGIQLLKNGDEVTLGTVSVMSPVIEKLLKEEISKDLGKAGLETLAIVLYRGPVSRSEVNYIRGVNSNYILRNLQVRGLIEKDEISSVRSTVYRPTFELLSYLGISSVEDLPEYENSRKVVEVFESESNTISE